jgi:GNAT superfamily N-acetyltransferase
MHPINQMLGTIESGMVLKDGTAVHIRSIRPEDDRLLIEIFNRLSPQSVYQRFFANVSELTPGMARYLANANSAQRMALMAEVAGEVVAVGRYEPTPDPETVELALVVLDEWQDKGLGRIMVREILKVGQANGIKKFRADVLADNRRMLHLLAQETEILERRTEAGVATLIVQSR